MSAPNRRRIDEVRRLLLDAFMSEDMAGYAQCVTELEDLIGVLHGDRNPKANGADVVNAARSAERRKAVSERALQFRWGNKSLHAEAHEDGTLIYSIKYGSEGERNE